MSGSDGRLAPVTYLPGVPVPAGADSASAHSASAHSASADAPAPSGPALLSEILAEASDSAPLFAEPDRAHRRAENVALHALTRRGLSKREVERTLRARDLGDDVVAEEVERLEGAGLIDDMALAQNLVGTLQERKGLGRSAVAAELTRRLLAPAAIEYALELVDTGDELARAREIAQKRAGQLRSYDHETAVRRLSAYLARRGYSGSTVRAAVEHALPSGASSRVRFQ